MKRSNLNSILVIATFPLIMMSCGTPHDRDAIVNPEIEGKLIVLKNVEDITKNSSSPALYSKSVATAAPAQIPSPGLLATSTTQTATQTSSGTITGDVQKLVSMVASADRKNYLERHLNSGGKIGFSIHQDHIRIYAETKKDVISKIASGPSDLTLADIAEAKKLKVDKNTYVKQTRTEINPVSTTRYLEVAALEIEKSGVLESEKTDYNETKPLLTINANLPIELSTHVLLKQEIVLSGAEKKDLFEPASSSVADPKK